MSVTNEVPDAVAEAAAYLYGKIVATEMALSDEHREYVKDHYRKKLQQLKWELAGIDPEHPSIRPPPAPAAEPTDPALRIRREIGKALGVWQNEENSSHIRAAALIKLAELQALLYQADGTPPSISVEDAHEHYNAMLAEKERLAASPPVPMGHTHITTRDGRNVNQQHHRMERTTELVSDPVAEHVHARRHSFQAAADQARYTPTFAGKTADQLVPNPAASPAYDLNSRGPSFTRPASLSGRTR